MFIESKALLPDSGGARSSIAAAWASSIEFVNDSGGEVVIAFPGRPHPSFAPRGRGRRGTSRWPCASVLVNGEPVADPRAATSWRQGDRLSTLEAGGGGIGDPLLRDARALQEDLAQGFVTPAQARAVYGWSGPG
jgi:N-methylhydantoinase B